MIEVYINDQLIDLGPKTTVALTYQINNIAELKDRQGNYSNQFKIPITSRNDSVFDNCRLVQSQSKIPYRKGKAKIIDNGVEVVPKGIAFMDSAGASYNLRIYSGNINFFDVISGKNLSDIDTTAVDHLWDIYHMVSPFPDVKYPLIDYDGNIDVNSNAGLPFINGNKMFPATRHDYVVKQIIEQAGFNRSGDIFNNQKYLAEFLPFSNDRLLGYFPTRVIIRNDIPHGNGVPEGTFFNDSFTGFNTDGFFYQKADPGFNYFPPAFQPTTGFFAKEDKVYDFHFRLNFALGPAAGTQLVIGFFKIDNTINGFMTQVGLKTYLNPVSGLIADDVISIPLLKGESLYMSMLYFGPGTIYRPFILLAQSYWECTNVIPEIKPIDQDFDITTISVANNLPSFTQTDFLKSWMQRYGLIVDVDIYNMTVRFSYFNDLQKNLSQAKDWSAKLDKKSVTDKDYIYTNAGDYGKQNNLLYSQDDDDTFVPIKDLFDYFFNIDDENLPDKKDLFTQPYAATAHKRIFTNQYLCCIINKIKPSEVELSIKTVPRIILLNEVLFNASEYKLRDPKSGSYYLQLIGYECWFYESTQSNNLDWQTLIDLYYPLFVFCLNYFKKITPEYVLTASDIHELDHFIPIYDSFFNAYFYLNKVSNYITGKNTKVELIRLQ